MQKIFNIFYVQMMESQRDSEGVLTASWSYMLSFGGQHKIFKQKVGSEGHMNWGEMYK